MNKRNSTKSRDILSCMSGLFSSGWIVVRPILIDLGSIWAQVARHPTAWNLKHRRFH